MEYSKVKKIKKAAEQGNSIAQNNLGVMYESGDGVEQNFNKAFEWYEKAALKGNDTAQCNLADLYFLHNNEIRQPDAFNKAIEWFEKAASQENAYAQFKLGLIYQMADICDYKKSFDMLKKSALQGYTRAYSQLAYCYLRGEGVEKNITEAIKWYEKGAAEDDEYCQERLGDL